jgi:hypothetical protein
MSSRTLAIGGKKKLGIHRKLQTICLLLATLLRLSKNVNRGRDITGFRLQGQEKISKRCICRK